MPPPLVRASLWLLLLAAAPLAGQESDRVTVRLDGRAVLRVGPAPGVDAQARAERIERRLATLLETPRAIAPARVEPLGDTARVVSVASVPVVTVGRADAEDNVLGLDPLAAQWARAVDGALVRARERRATGWSRFAVGVRGSVRTAFARLAESAIVVVPRAIAAFLVIAAFGLLATAVRWLLRVLFRRVVSDLTLENLVKQLAYYAVWALGILVAVDALGFRPQTVVTGLGLTSLALGFALKDIISNFVSGLLILALRPFQIGDQIVVQGVEGSVERIRLRATEIRTYGGRLVLVPNAELFTSRLTNNTASPVRRGRVRLFLGYDADARRAMEVIRQAAAEAEGVLADPPAGVRIVDLGQDDLELEVRFWADSRRSDFVATRAAVRAAVVEAMRRAGIALPDPDTRFLAMRQGPLDLRLDRARRGEEGEPGPRG
jgi:small conductance mechanosensitive channel